MVATPNICLDPPANQRDIPRLTLRPGQVTGLLDQLHRFWQRFAPLFQRREQRELGLTYLQGRLMDGDKRYTQPMARRLGVNNVRTLQNFVGASPWDGLAVLEEHQQAVQETLADAEELVIIDGTGFPRKGTESAGVARQYCNETGKVDNCQVGIFLAYASPRGYSLLDRRLYLPEEWFSPAYAAHRQLCMNDKIKVTHLTTTVMIEKCTTVQESGILRVSAIHSSVYRRKGDDHRGQEGTNPSGSLPRRQEPPPDPTRDRLPSGDHPPGPGGRRGASLHPPGATA
jgi:hypothetical protein